MPLLNRIIGVVRIDPSPPVGVEVGLVISFLVAQVHGARTAEGVSASLDETHINSFTVGYDMSFVADSSLSLRYLAQRQMTTAVARSSSGCSPAKAS